MPDISTLRGIKSDEIARLRKEGCDTREQLWQLLSEPQQAEFAAIAAEAHLTRERVVEFLAAGFVVRNELWVAFVSERQKRIREIASTVGLSPDRLIELLKTNALLRSHDLGATREQIWKLIDEKGEQPTVEFALNTGFEKDWLLEWLADDALDKAANLALPERGVRRTLQVALSGLKRHILDLSALIAVLLLGGLLFHAYRAYRSGYSDQVVVTAASGLEAFHAISRTDITLRRTQRVAGSFARLEDALGKYPSENVAKGVVLTAKHLQTDPALLADLHARSILTILVKAGGPVSDPGPSRQVSLLLSPHADAKATESVPIKNVLLLTLRHERDGTWATVALLSDQLTIIGPLLGSSDVYIVWPPA